MNSVVFFETESWGERFSEQVERVCGGGGL